MKTAERPLDNTDQASMPYGEIINEYISYIEARCRKAVEKNPAYAGGEAGEIALENESMELFNRVLDKLQENDFKILAQFKDNSKLSTYLSAIIARQLVDMIRQKRGRSREKERARELGPQGEYIYQAVFRQGLTLQLVLQELKERFGPDMTLKKLEDMMDRIKGRDRLDNPQGALQPGTLDPGSGEMVIKDPGQGPEEAALNQSRNTKIKEAVYHVIDRLKGEERLLLRLRFPADDSEPLEIEQIARLLDISSKAVYNRLSRLLKKCRDLLVKNGVNPDELL